MTRVLLLAFAGLLGFHLYSNWYKFRPIYGKRIDPDIRNVFTGERITPKPAQPSFNSYIDSQGREVATY